MIWSGQKVAKPILKQTCRSLLHQPATRAWATWHGPKWTRSYVFSLIFHTDCIAVVSNVTRVFVQSAELFAMTYGAIVTQMLKDYEDVEAVNTELDKMYILISMQYCSWMSFLCDFCIRSGVTMSVAV
jgi:hypothetical protein